MTTYHLDKYLKAANMVLNNKNPNLTAANEIASKMDMDLEFILEALYLKKWSDKVKPKIAPPELDADAV